MYSKKGKLLVKVKITHNGPDEISLTCYLSVMSRNCLPFRSTWIHPRFLVGFVFLYICFMCNVLQIVICTLFFFWCCLSFVDFWILITHLMSSNSSCYSRYVCILGIQFQIELNHSKYLGTFQEIIVDMERKKPSKINLYS